MFHLVSILLLLVTISTYCFHANRSYSRLQAAEPSQAEAPPLKAVVPFKKPPTAKRAILYFGGESWCPKSRSTKQEIERFARSRSLVIRRRGDLRPGEADIVLYDITPHGQLTGSLNAPPVRIGAVPAIVLVDGMGKELSRIEGGSNVKAIESLWLCGRNSK